MLVGLNLWHIWKNSARHYEKMVSPGANARVILFREDCFDESFVKTPEMQPIQALSQRAKRGIHFYGKTQRIMADRMVKSYSQQGTKRLLTFLDILHDLAHSQQCTTLSSLSYT